MSAPYGLTLARVGAGVTDLDLAVDFYTALGFTPSGPYDLGTRIADQSETPDVPLVIHIVRRDGLALELCQPGPSRPPGPPARRPLNLLGLTHLAFAVDDVDRVVALVTAHGGRGYPFARSNAGDGELGVDAAFCTDPCGLRLLLLGPGDGPLGVPPAGPDGIAVAHLGMCVADLDASAAFYRALGFAVGPVTDVGTAFSRLAEIDGARSRVCPAAKDGHRFLLVEWGGPRDPGIPVRLPLNRTGQLIHLGTHCEDFAAMLDVVATAGGTIVERTRAVFPPPGLTAPGIDDPQGWVFVLDPNGVQIEVVGPQYAQA